MFEHHHTCPSTGTAPRGHPCAAGIRPRLKREGFGGAPGDAGKDVGAAGGGDSAGFYALRSSPIVPEPARCWAAGLWRFLMAASLCPRAAPWPGVSSVAGPFPGARHPQSMLFLPILLLFMGYPLVILYPANGLLIWLIYFKATLGGLGSSHPAGGTRRVRRRCSETGHLHQQHVIPDTIILSYI